MDCISGGKCKVGKYCQCVACDKAGTSAEVPGYDEIVGVIKEAPVTYLPALLLNTVETCLARGVFVNGTTLTEVVAKIVAKYES